MCDVVGIQNISAYLHCTIQYELHFVNWKYGQPKSNRNEL